MDEFYDDELMEFERDADILPFIDEMGTEDDELYDDIYEEIALFSRAIPKEDTSPRLAEEETTD